MTNVAGLLSRGAFVCNWTQTNEQSCCFRKARFNLSQTAHDIVTVHGK